MMTAKGYAEQGFSLSRLFDGLAAENVPEIMIRGLSQDSRRIQSGDLFLACQGNQSHGIEHIEQAIARGAVAVAIEPGHNTASVDPAAYAVPVFWIEGLNGLLSELGGRFYAHPSHEMRLIGVTGTNGKTSVSQFIAQALSEDAPCGVIGTLGSGVYGELMDTGHTTPDAISVQAMLAAMRDDGVGHAALEVSSHALMQGRVAALSFDVAVYTNLSHEHLDYHGDMSAYAAAKQRLFMMPGLSQAVINVDDSVGREWINALPGGMRLWRYGLEGGSGNELEHEVIGRELSLSRQGMRMQLECGEQTGSLHSVLLGRFNAANLLAGVTALCALGLSLEDVLARLARVKTVPGRMEGFGGQGRPLVVVDYAHTPDALAKVLEALREHCEGRLWCVFGCGGERDKEKRPRMGGIAEALADSVIITDDNPRNEDPYEIIEQILSGMSNPDAVYVNRERAAAIAHAIALSRPQDVILVAGKGHERTQQFGGHKLAFSDRDEVARLLGEAVRRG
jgi:UDP-N-acetylmuramoyl-L-alanyl-D-glutamate--2,6-diaminopimelate ligase